MSLLLLRRLSCKSAISPLFRNPPCFILSRNPMSTTTTPQNDGTDLSSVFTDEISRDILGFWFGDSGLHPTMDQVMRWFRTDEEFDEQCRSKFSSVLSKIAGHPPSSITSLATSPERALSLLVLLDQIPRNIFRGDLSSKVYIETDPLAVAVSLHSLSSSLRYDLGPSNAWKSVPSRRIWFAMPLSHSEDPELHKRVSEDYAEELMGDCIQEGEKSVEFAKTFQMSMKEHRAIIDMFGRYPYRNKVLGRKDTSEEKAWLENPVSWAR